MFVCFKKIFEKIRYHKQINNKKGSINLNIIDKINNMSLYDLEEFKKERIQLMYSIKYNKKYIKTIKLELNFINKRIYLLKLSDKETNEQIIYNDYYN